MVLNASERHLVHTAFGQGPTALTEAGMEAQAVSDFLQRDDVQAELRLLTKEFEHQDSIDALIKFSAKRELRGMKGIATNVIRQALIGPEYLTLNGEVQRDEMGKPILICAEPSQGQRQTAMNVLDRLNVLPNPNATATANVDVTVLFNQNEESTVEIKTDNTHTTEEQRSLSRERVRNIIETLGLKFNKMKKTADKQIAVEKKVKKKKVKKKTVKKKTVKKKTKKKG